MVRKSTQRSKKIYVKKRRMPKGKAEEALRRKENVYRMSSYTYKKTIKLHELVEII